MWQIAIVHTFATVNDGGF